VEDPLKIAMKTAELTLAEGEPPGAGNRRTTNLEYREISLIGQPQEGRKAHGARLKATPLR
jgi:hypothetical protein